MCFFLGAAGCGLSESEVVSFCGDVVGGLFVEFVEVFESYAVGLGDAVHGFAGCDAVGYIVGFGFSVFFFEVDYVAWV